MGKLGQPEDMANAVFFLASGQAAFITSQSLKVTSKIINQKPPYDKKEKVHTAGRMERLRNWRHGLFAGLCQQKH